MLTVFESEFNFGDAVTIDGGSVHGRVIGIAFYSHDYQVQVSWWNSGALVESWISTWRLKKQET
jgi:hypothetical protein